MLAAFQRAKGPGKAGHASLRILEKANTGGRHTVMWLLRDNGHD